LNNILINVTSEMKKRNLICVHVEQVDFKTFNIFEIIEAFYEHPDSKGNSYIQKYEKNLLKTVNIGSVEFSQAVLLFNQQNVSKTIFKIL